MKISATFKVIETLFTPNLPHLRFPYLASGSALELHILADEATKALTYTVFQVTCLKISEG